MPDHVRTIHLRAMTITIINAGDIQGALRA